MHFSELFDRVRRFSVASVCFVIATILVRKGNAGFDGGTTQMVVPLMCVATAMTLCLLGLALFVKADAAAE